MAIEAGRLNIDLLIKQGNLTLTDLNAKKDLQIIDDNMNETTGMISRVVTVADSNVIFTLANMGVEKGRFIYVESDQIITVKLRSDLDSAADQLIWVAPPTSDPTGQVVDTNVRKVGILALKTQGVTHVTVLNASGNDANVRLLACGYSTDT